MRKLFAVLFLVLGPVVHAQEEVVHSVYFEFDKHDIDADQAQSLLNFMKTADSARIESVEIFGYTDDVGKDDYNFKLSARRAAEVQNILVTGGVKNRIIVTIEGKGRILIEDDLDENLPEKRSKNRRVDIVQHLKPLPKIQIPGMYTTVQNKHVVGDQIYLENLLFERGSSKLTFQAKTQLDKLTRMLFKHKNLHFEIQGHVCCTPPYHREAIDLATKKRHLSTNRAEAVYKYLVFKKIPKNRMTFKGYGNTVPLGREPEYDRRVQLVITKI